jgi:hypothetical protein
MEKDLVKKGKKYIRAPDGSRIHLAQSNSTNLALLDALGQD